MTANRTRPPTIDLVAASEEGDALPVWLKVALKGIGSLTAGAAAVLGILILGRLAIALILKSKAADPLGRAAMLAGADPAIGAWLTGAVSFGIGLALVTAACKAFLYAMLPIPRPAGAWKSTALLVALSGVGAVSPAVIKSVRGVDDRGLPAFMQRVDPAEARWFDPDGKPLIFFSEEPGGEMIAFWDRPGFTPMSRSESKPVTDALYREWSAARDRQAEEQLAEKRRLEQEEAAAKAAEAARQREAEKRQLEDEQRRAAEAKRAADEELERLRS